MAGRKAQGSPSAFRFQHSEDAVPIPPGQAEAGVRSEPVHWESLEIFNYIDTITDKDYFRQRKLSDYR